MRTFYLLIMILFSANRVYSHGLTNQELDSLYNKLIYLNSSQFKTKTLQTFEGESKYEKCGFGLVSSIILNMNRYTPQQQSDIKRILQKPELQDSLITPNGFFKVHYNATGINKPSYDNLPLDDCLNFILQPWIRFIILK